MLLKILDEVKDLAPSAMASKDPEEPNLYIVTLRFPRSRVAKMKEDLERSYYSAERRYGRVSEKGLEDEGVDAWLYVEGDINGIEELLNEVSRSEDVLGTLELKGGSYSALIYPKGSLSAFAIDMAYRMSKELSKDVLTFSLIGYELTKDHVDVSIYASTAEECAPEHEHEEEHEHEHEEEHEGEML